MIQILRVTEDNNREINTCVSCIIGFICHDWFCGGGDIYKTDANFSWERCWLGNNTDDGFGATKREKEVTNKCQDTKGRNNHPISNVGNVSLSPRESLAEYTASSLS